MARFATHGKICTTQQDILHMARNTPHTKICPTRQSMPHTSLKQKRHICNSIAAVCLGRWLNNWKVTKKRQKFVHCQFSLEGFHWKAKWFWNSLLTCIYRWLHVHVRVNYSKQTFRSKILKWSTMVFVPYFLNYTPGPLFPSVEFFLPVSLRGQPQIGAKPLLFLFQRERKGKDPGHESISKYSFPHL